MDPEPGESLATGQSSSADIPDTQLYNRLDPSNPGIIVRFYEPVHDESSRDIVRFVDRSKQPSYHDTIVSEGRKILRGALRDGDRYVRCCFFRLPIDVRFRVYEELFKHDGSPLEIGRLKRTGVANLAILRVSHVVYHEASIALYHSLSYRRLFLRTYGSFSADLLRRFPQPLPCCRNRKFEKWLEYPCLTHKLGWRRSFGSVLLLLGSTDFKTALQRRWSFSEFITTLRMDEPLRVFTLTVVVTDNWKMPGFDEKDLVKALFGGAFDFLGKLNLRGFNEEERDCIAQLIHDLRLPHLKFEREKKRIQGPGFCIWICKLMIPSPYPLRAIAI